MKAPMYVRALSPAERAEREAGLRPADAFPLRRSQILLASNREQLPKAITRNLGCATQAVRNAIHAFNEKGLVWSVAQQDRTKVGPGQECDHRTS